jgi:hypothetical protein
MSLPADRHTGGTLSLTSEVGSPRGTGQTLAASSLGPANSFSLDALPVL